MLENSLADAIQLPTGAQGGLKRRRHACDVFRPKRMIVELARREQLRLGLPCASGDELVSLGFGPKNGQKPEPSGEPAARPSAQEGAETIPAAG